MSGLFRREAIEHHAKAEVQGDVLRCDPRWIKVTFRAVIAAVIAGILFCALFSVDEYATGPAVIRVDGRRMVTAQAAGAVEELAVKPGQRVAANDVLVRLVAQDEATELARATSEFELQLVRSLVDPNDPAARQAIGPLRARRDTAKNLVDSRTIRAPVAGIVSDVRVRAGQHVTPGDVLCAVVPASAQNVSLVAMVPADYRPMLRAGLDVRFELDGFRYEYSDVKVDDVSTEAIGPLEVQRFLGSERADSVKLDPGAKVFVTGRLPASTFTSDGQPYGYFDGLTGTAEVRVRREPILVTLIPALRQVMP